ncbi:MAG: hypothetical protein QNJ13_09400 [Paracoccaceae bacterium]|nr:hypothetical protein [Paracoccaceae bacterium]
MSAQLALDLDHDAIRLLSHQSDGWVVEGVAELTAHDLTGRITALRQRAEDLAGANPGVLLVLPRSQVLYTRFDGLGDPDREIAERLDGMTPYAVSEIAWDHVTDEGETQVAAVAHETLDEALAFAASSRFPVVGVTSEPPEGAFPRMPVFRREAQGARPLVLEPDAPPARQTVAFSENRDVDHRPVSAEPRPAAAARPRRPAIPRPARLAGLLAGIPKPLAAAAIVGSAVIAGAALWPEGDPDPLADAGLDRSFAEAPAGLAGGLSPPAETRAPRPLAGLEAVTVLRDAPAIAVPVIIGASTVSADYAAGAAPSEVFERIAASPAEVSEFQAPSAHAARPVVAARPDFPQAEPLERAAVAVLPPPAALPSPPTEASLGNVAVGADNAVEVARATATLPPAAMPATPDLARPDRVRPTALVEAPTEGLAPSTSPAYVLGAPLPVDPEVGVALAALPEAGAIAERLPDPAMALSPPPAGERFDLGADGFVVATPEGTRTPGGVLAFASPPPLVAPPRPGTAVSAPPAEVAETEAPSNPNPQLAAVLPQPRPGASGEAAAEATAVAPEAPEVPEAVIAEALAADPAPPEAEPVMTASLVPRPRPARPAAAPAPSATAAATRAAPTQPRIPSRANVAREATIEDAIPLGRLNLIGVYGSANDRRALVRLPTGRFVKLQVGDRLDGGQVAQIGPDRLLYQKGGRTVALEMPNT